MSELFELQYSGEVDEVVPVFKYRSKSSGLTIVVAQVPGPLVNGYFCLATEAHDDDGLPHTLEHLVFMGSDSYPYKVSTSFKGHFFTQCLGIIFFVGRS